MTDKEIEKLYKNSSELTPPPELKGKILLRMSEEMDKKNERRKKPSFGVIAKRLMPIAACFVLLIILLGGVFGFANEKYQTVYIDINPSVALGVNRFGKVSNVEYLNEDAKEALKGVKLKGLSAEDALEKMIEAYDGAGYFAGDAEIYISAVSEKNKNADKLLAKLSERAENVKGARGYSVNISKPTAEDRAEAEKYNISPGKYKVISEIIEKYPEYIVEDLKDKSMAELKDMLSKGKK